MQTIIAVSNNVFPLAGCGEAGSQQIKYIGTRLQNPTTIKSLAISTNHASLAHHGANLTRIRHAQ